MSITIDRNKEIIAFLLILLFSIFFISADAYESIKLYDEGVTVYGATRVLDGYLPYRDFWTAYMPGHYYLYAIVFKIFGVSLLAERITSILLIVCISVVTFFIARKALPAMLALLVFFFSVIWLSSFEFFAYILHPTLLCSLISINFFLNYLLKSRKRALLWAGIFAGITTLFRHDFGFYVFGAEVLILIISQLLSREHTSPQKTVIMFKNTVPLIFLGTAITFLPIAIYFLINVPFQDIYDSLIAFPLNVYPDYRSIPFPTPFTTFTQFQEQVNHATFSDYIKENLDRLYFYFPVIVFFALFLQLFITSIRNQDFIKTKKFWFYVSILVFGLLFFTKVIIRSVHLNLMPSYVIAILAYFMVLFNIGKTLSSKNINRIAYILLGLLAFPALIRPLWSESVGLRLNHNVEVSLNFARSENIYWDVRGHEYNKVIHYVDSLVPATDKIFVGSIRHDRIFTNDVLFYFLAERESATKYYELHPGVATTLEVQEEIVADITAAGVKCIVLKEETRIETENKSGESSGVTLLDDFIRHNFQLDKSFGDYSIWVKKDTAGYFY